MWRIYKYHYTIYIIVYHKMVIDNRFHYKITYESNNSQLSEDIENLIEKWKMSIEKFRYL